MSTAAALQLSRPATMTLQEYENTPENARIELINGILYNMASPSQSHQSILRELGTEFTLYLRKKKGPCQVFLAPFDVVLQKTPPTVVQPDLMVVCDPEKLDGKRCNGAPDLVMEIVSPSSAMTDFLVKYRAYMKAGVKEYWIVEPDARRVTLAFHDENGEPEEDCYSFNDTVPSLLYPDLKLNFPEIVTRAGLPAEEED